MRKRFHPLVCLAPLIAVALATAPASGAIFLPLDNWTIDLGGVPGSNNTQIQGVDRVHFNAINHVVVNGPVAPGSTVRIEGLIRATEFFDDDFGNAIPVAGLNGSAANTDSFELTGRFSTTVQIESVDLAGPTPNFTYRHRPDLGDPLSTGILELWLDNYGDPAGGAQASITNLAGYTDGLRFANFSDTIQPDIFGVQPLSDSPLPAGADASLFSFLFGEEGVLFGADGTDLIASGLLQSIFSTEQIRGPGSVAGNPELQWNVVFPGSDVTLSDTNFFAAGNGEAQISIVPEPSSLALAMIGATAMAGYFWRRRRQDQPNVE